jgi:hypothetical protein
VNETIPLPLPQSRPFRGVAVALLVRQEAALSQALLWQVSAGELIIGAMAWKAARPNPDRKLRLRVWAILRMKQGMLERINQ